MLRSELQWDTVTQTLSGWAKIRGKREFVTLPREAIESWPLFNDLVEWEIERFKHEIVDRLVPLLRQVAE